MSIPLYMSEEAMNRVSGRPSEEKMNEYHDFIEEMIGTEDFWLRLDPPTQQAMLVCRDTLCFALGHKNNSVEENIQTWANGFMRHKGIDSTHPN